VRALGGGGGGAAGLEMLITLLLVALFAMPRGYTTIGKISGSDGTPPGQLIRTMSDLNGLLRMLIQSKNNVKLSFTL